MLATITVNSLADNVIPGDGLITLREAIQAANQDDTHDTIEFDLSLNGSTITLTQGQLAITESVTIDASTLANAVTIDASGNDTNPAVDDGLGTNIFDIQVNNFTGTQDIVTVKSLRLTGGDASLDGGAISFRGFNPDAILRVEDCVIFDNSIGGSFGNFGGGVFLNTGRLEMRRTVLENNRATIGGGGVTLNGSSIASALIEDSQFLSNKSQGAGGGLYLFLQGDTTIFVTHCLFVENEALGTNDVADTYHGSGGGIYADLHGAEGFTPTMSMDTTTLDKNTAAKAGGGAFFVGKFGSFVDIIDSTVSNNDAGMFDSEFPEGQGGGLWLGNDPFQNGANHYDLKQVTVSGNDADSAGGGVWIGHTDFLPVVEGLGDVVVTMDFVTITMNRSPEGGGLFSEPDAEHLRISTTLNNTIVSGNSLITSTSTHNNVAGRINSNSSYNLLGTGGGATLPTTDSPQRNIHSDAPQLALLADNGGPTQTHRPQTGSPALDAGNPNVTFNANEFDQRGPGFPRVFDISTITHTLPPRGPVDIGAYEVGAPKVLDVIVSSTTANQSLHPPYSFATATYDGQPVVGSGNQLRTVPVGGADQISIKFSEDVSNVAVGHLDFQALTTDVSPDPTNVAYSSGTRTATWTYGAGFAPDQYVIRLSDAIVGAAGALDGEWINPYSILTANPDVNEFPSGNGSAGGAFNFVLTILPGDADRSNIVDGVDFLIWMMNYTGTGRSFEQADFTGEGTVNGVDYSYLGGYPGQFFHSLNIADFDQDGFIGGSDFLIWQSNYGATEIGHSDGDADHDGDVDDNDYYLFLRQFGWQVTWVE